MTKTVRRKSLAQESRAKANIGDAPTAGISERHTMRILERFWSKVDMRGPDECWPWLGASVKSYGRFYLNREMTSVPAHVLAWELENAAEFPIGLESRHTCDNPICVNPRHIVPGTHSENVRDCVERGRHPEAIKTMCVRGHEFTPANTYFFRGFRHCRKCRQIRKAKWRASST